MLTATQGEHFTVAIAELTGGAGFAPLIEIFAPNGMRIAVDSDPLATRVDVQANVTGTFTAVISDLNHIGTGTYRLRYAKIPGAFAIPPSDEGGPLTNGVNHQGAIALGGLDLWTIAANAGDRVTVQIAELSGGAGFSPMIELFSPTGIRLGIASNTLAARLDIQAGAAGTYTVLVSDANQTGAGTYQLRLAQTPVAFVVPSGDEGGAMVNGTNHQGAIDLGDMDLWTFSATRGDRIVLQLGELTGASSFNPMIELFAPNGSRLAVDSNTLVARVDAQAETTGTYTVMVSDSSPSGTGTYQLQLVRVAGGSFALSPGDEGGALVDGVNSDGAIPVGDLDPWTFTAAAGDRVTIQLMELTGGASFTPRFELFDPKGERKRNAAGTLGATNETVIDLGGTYTVLVGDTNRTGTGTYRLLLTRSTVAPLSANILTNGTTHFGEVAVPGQSNAWTFRASSGDRIILRLGDTSGSGFTPAIRLYNPANLLVDSSSGTTAAEVNVVAATNGTFKVIVADNSGTGLQIGTYRLTLVKTGNPLVISPGDEGGPITNGFTYTGAIDTGDIDGWTFVANTGEQIALRVGEISNGSGFTPWMRVYGPDGTQLGTSYGTLAADFADRAPSSGTYTVVVGDGTGTLSGDGTYRLTLAKTGSPLGVTIGDEGGLMTNGLTYTAGIDTGDIDAWTFIANTGENIVLRIGEVSDGSGFTPWIRLFAPDGTQLGSGYGTLAAEISVRLTSPGTYTVVAGDGNGSVSGDGTYRLCVVKTGSPLAISAGDEGGTMVNGLTHTAAIDTGDIDGWSFAANAGEYVVVRVGEISNGTGFTPWIRLFSPDGVQLGSGYGTLAGEVAVRLTSPGIYTVVAGDGNGSVSGTGTYRLTLAKTGSPVTISNGDEGGPLTNGYTHTASIDAGDIDAWNFTANAGEYIVVRIGEITDISGFTPWIRLFGPDGVQLDSGYGSLAGEVLALATTNGTYTVVAGDGSGAIGAEGTYRLTLAKSATPSVIAPGDEGGALTGNNTEVGTIEVGELDAWSFTACGGESISLTVTELVNGSGLYPWIRLFGRDGTLLNSVSGPATAQIIRTAPTSGIYTLVIGDGNSSLGASGTYQLDVNGLTDEMRLCMPVVLGTNLNLRGIGGISNTTFVVYSHTNATTPYVQWTPFLTNQFDQFGVFSRSNALNRAERQRYFRLQR